MLFLGKLPRRELLGYGAAGALGLARTPLALGQATDARPALRFRRVRTPKNVIFMVADGMAASVPTMADRLRRLRDGKHSFWAECSSTIRWPLRTRSASRIEFAQKDGQAVIPEALMAYYAPEDDECCDHGAARRS